jgi:hypothetical protein
MSASDAAPGEKRGRDDDFDEEEVRCSTWYNLPPGEVSRLWSALWCDVAMSGKAARSVWNGLIVKQLSLSLSLSLSPHATLCPSKRVCSAETPPHPSTVQHTSEWDMRGRGGR